MIIDLPDFDEIPDPDVLSRTCPGCGAAATWPDCEACGFDLTGPQPDPAPSSLDAEAGAVLDEAEPPRLVPVPLEDLMRTEPPAVRFVVKPIIPRRLATLLSAHGGTGKSSLALTIAAHVAAGQPWAGFDVIQGRALVVSLEDPGDVVRWRLRRIVEAFELDPKAVLSAVVVLDGSDLRDGIMHERMFEGVRYLVESPPFKELREHAAGASLIVLDNASDAADFNENERRHVRHFIRALAKLARDADAGLLLLAHIDKTAARYGSQGESYSGSTAWHNSVRSRLALLAQDGGTVELVHEKANLTAKAEPCLFAWSADGVLLPTTAQAAQAGALAASGILAAEDARHVLDALLTAHRGAAPVSASREGAHSARTTLANCGLPEELAKGSAARFYRALDLLLSDGRAVIEEITTADRKTRKRLFPAPNLRAQPLRASIPPYPPSDDGRTGCAPIAPVMRPTDERGSAHPIQPPAWAIDPKAGPDPEKVAA